MGNHGNKTLSTTLELDFTITTHQRLTYPSPSLRTSVSGHSWYS